MSLTITSVISRGSYVILVLLAQGRLSSEPSLRIGWQLLVETRFCQRVSQTRIRFSKEIIFLIRRYM